MVSGKKWEQLREHDELTREMAKGKVFAGFSDALDWEVDVGSRGLIPTFKMQRRRRWQYFAQRVPSYCDRVLWRSAPGAADCFKLEDFSAAASLVTSDHKPVFAKFALKAPTPMHERVEEYLQQPREADTVTFACVRLTNIKITGTWPGEKKGPGQEAWLAVRSFDSENHPIFIRGAFLR